MTLPKWKYAKKCMLMQLYGGKLTWYQKICAKYGVLRAELILKQRGE